LFVVELLCVDELVQLGDLDAAGLDAALDQCCNGIGAHRSAYPLLRGRANASTWHSTAIDTRAFLEGLEARLAAGEAVDVEVSLILVAGQDVPLEDHEASGARRRAVQLLAAGGDPRRELEPD